MKKTQYHQILFVAEILRRNGFDITTMMLGKFLHLQAFFNAAAESPQNTALIMFMLQPLPKSSVIGWLSHEKI